MRPRSVAAILIVTAVLFVMAVASEVFIVDLLHPTSLFGYLILTTLGSGLMASIVLERFNMQMNI